MTEKRHGKLRRFNRNFLNRITRLFAGRFFYSLVYHTGRITGKQYSTPVIAAKGDAQIFIPLPYGADTDWYLNIKAIGCCQVKMRGKIYAANNPEITDEKTALPAFSRSLQCAFKKAAINQFLILHLN